MIRPLTLLSVIAAITLSARSQTDEKVDAMLTANFSASSFFGRYDRWLKPDGTYFEFSSLYHSPTGAPDQNYSNRTGTYRVVRSTSNPQLLDLYFDGLFSTTLNFSTHQGSNYTSYAFTWLERTAADGTTNTSARAYVTPDHPAIAGFVIAGAKSRLVLIRAVGPGLLNFTVKDAVPSTKLAVYRGAQFWSSANGWTPTGPYAQVVQELESYVGAFPLTSTSDSEMLIALAPGAYTVQTTAADSTASGTVLTEVYSLNYIEK